jgi:hypothetical protein
MSLDVNVPREVNTMRLKMIALCVLVTSTLFTLANATEGAVNAQQNDRSESVSKCTIARVAERYIAKHLPRIDPTGWEVIVEQKGDGQWEVGYMRPPKVVNGKIEAVFLGGGMPELTIDAKGMKVVKVMYSQ